MEKQQPNKLTITTKEGSPFQVPVEGSLGLLALGYKGLIAWRQVKRQYNKAKAAHNQQTKENNNPEKKD